MNQKKWLLNEITKSHFDLLLNKADDIGPKDVMQRKHSFGTWSFQRVVCCLNQ